MKDSNKLNQILRSNAKEESIDCEGLLLIPGFVNCHTHIGDSIAKDITIEQFS